MTNGYLDNVFFDFSGYIAVDELYDGNTCLLALVDNRRNRRLMFEILDHNPKHEDIVAFFQRFKREMEKRGSRLLGITTDGSPLYPGPILQVFGSIPHQICVFHVIKEINKAILKAVASVRREIAEQVPEATRGRPAGKAGKAAARKRKRLEKKIGDLFEHRHLFVRRKLSPTEKRTLRKITRGVPVLRALREIVEDVYRLFDRRCRMEAGLKKLQKLRVRVKRFKRLAKILKKLLTPTLEKSLVFLNEKLLPSTSNAVERTNRRFRKMQKAIYRARAVHRIRQRVALDILREWRLPARHSAIKLLSNQRRHLC